MKFHDIPASALSIRIKSTDISDKLEEQPVLSVTASLKRAGQFEIFLKDGVIFAIPVVKADILRLNNELVRGHAYLAQLANPAADDSIELQIVFFLGECLEMGDIEIGVDEYVEKAIAKIAGRQLQKEKLNNRLNELCCFEQGGESYFFLTAGYAIDEAIKPESAPTQSLENTIEENDDNESDEIAENESSVLSNAIGFSQAIIPTIKNSFCVTGNGIRFVATKSQRPDGQFIFISTRLTKLKNKPDRALRIAKGNLKFVDWTQAGQIQLLAQAQMSALTKDEGSYLKKWDEFGDIEGEILLKKAREVGVLLYSNCKQNRDGTVSLRIQASDSALNALKAGKVADVDFVNEIPDYLVNDNLKFHEFAKGIEEQSKNEQFFEKKSQTEEKTTYKLNAFDAESKTIILNDEKIAPSGNLVLSLAGEIAQIKRRISARRAILEGRAANPQLGLLIEEKGQISPIRPPHKIQPLTAFVCNKVFPKNPPTLMQEKAIEVALNTPDIALIQGPPGTGKTTVIAAILERLNEMADKRGKSIKGQVLLTGFQHDAVENMIDRLSLNSIPVPKFGKRSGSTDDDLSNFEKNLEEWCEKLATELRHKNPQIAEIQQEAKIKNLCVQYIHAPTQVLGLQLIEQIALLGVSILGEELSRRASQLATRLSNESKVSEQSADLLNAVRRLRVRAESFADDGVERATDALEDLKDVLNKSEYQLLDKASLWCNDDGVPPFLNELAELKKSLLIQFATPPVFRLEKQNDTVIALAEESIKKIKIAGYSAKDKKSAALAEFLDELENNPDGMIDAVAEYSFAFAATCQQSVNHQMQRQKGIKRNATDQSIEYEYVIVDEAARVSPRDLMIPMAQGKRIILVGDHRQLPHIIDEEVANQMEAGEAGQTESDWLKKSLFQYLFSERLKTLEENDGITRRVTLDKQYRTHPILGDFISRNFYERFDSLEKFGSGRPASDFTHYLPNTDNKAAIWLNVPVNKGKHQRAGTSWTRPAEATAIVHQLQAWMNSDAGKSLTFGVISFYKAQAEAIKKQLGSLADDDKKLRIGTVDSFQGMEFDVVFLSIVRTLPNGMQLNQDNLEKQARSLFGHLCLYNRLNVSMSRQKKLLVVVGDCELVGNDIAAEFIPGLVDFFKLCQSEGKVLS